MKMLMKTRECEGKSKRTLKVKKAVAIKKATVILLLSTVMIFCSAVAWGETMDEYVGTSSESMNEFAATGGESTTAYGSMESDYIQTPDSWAQEAVDGMWRNGLVDSNLLKDYDKEITRSEFAMLVMNVYHKATGKRSNEIKKTDSFKDVAEPWVSNAYTLGIVKGVSSTSFDPDSSIERQAICTMIVRLLDAVNNKPTAVSGLTVENFSDAPRIEAWAKPYVAYCVKNGIMQGTSATTIAPAEKVTRQQAITLMYRFAVNKGYIEKENSSNGTYNLNGFTIRKDTKLKISSELKYGMLISVSAMDGNFPSGAEEMKALFKSGLSSEAYAKIERGINFCLNNIDKNSRGNWVVGDITIFSNYTVDTGELTISVYKE